jgi:hypothetical protein
MLGSSGGASLGASAAIFGLLGVAMMWAPRNDFECLWRFGTCEIPVLVFAGFKFALEAVGVIFQGFAMSGSLLHLMGAAFGLALGEVWIKRGWVDCEGHDLFSVMTGNEGRRAANESVDREATALLDGAYQKKAAGVRPTPAIAPSFPPAIPFGLATAGSSGTPAAVIGQRSVSALPRQPVIADFDSLDDLFGPGSAGPTDNGAQTHRDDLERALAESRFADVPKLLQQVRQFDCDYEIPQAPLLCWIESLLAKKQYAAAVPLMNQHIRRFEHKRPAMQLQLAKILLHLKHPQQALQVLQRIEVAKVSEAGRKTVEQLIAQAKSTAAKPMA